MTPIPITHITLYKHGVGFFERRARISGEEIRVDFRVEDMNDVLKSFTALDVGGGQVLGVDYATPQSKEERLAGSTIRLEDDRSLRDLLVGLRGRKARLHLRGGEQVTGTLIGLDEPAERQPMGSGLVTLLLENSSRVQAAELERVEGLEILDEQGMRDLRFFLEASLAQEQHRQVTVRLTPGEHDLSVSYVAPAPTWRVSYRLLMEDAPDPDGAGQRGAGGSRRALLLGWGIFDNRLEEDLQNISLTLVAGMPISFVYDLYTPFTPERPVVQEEARVAAAPVEFEERTLRDSAGAHPDAPRMLRKAAFAAAPAPMAASAVRDASLDQFAGAAPAQVQGESLGELFQYAIQTPVTVGRGQSAMVPIISARLELAKDLLYNSIKFPAHPVSTARLKNESGLTLERGPVTVLDGGEYVGEAVLPFTAADGELVVAYAVELGVKVQEADGFRVEVRGLNLRGALVQLEEWHIRWRDYQLNNSTAQPVSVLIEHPRAPEFEPFDTPEPVETTAEHRRYPVEVPARGEVRLRVSERTLVKRAEELRRVSYEDLRRYLQGGLIDKAVYNKVLDLLRIWERIADRERDLNQVAREREKVYKSQEQVRHNMGALGEGGREGKMRAYYVDQLEASEAQLQQLAARETALHAEIEQLKAEVEAFVKTLGGEE